MNNWIFWYCVGMGITLFFTMASLFRYIPEKREDDVPVRLASYIISAFLVVLVLFWPILLFLETIIWLVSIIKNYKTWKRLEKELNDNPILRAALQDEIKKATEQYTGNGFPD